LEFAETDVSELVNRIRALTLVLLPLEVNAESLNDPTSRVITSQVIATYTAAAGDFVEAVRAGSLIELSLPKLLSS